MRPTIGNEAALAALLSDIRACRACAVDFAHEPRPVVHLSSKTRLLVCGPAPGRRVQESGLPFDDPSGDSLRAWLGLDRETFYRDPRIGVASMGFCYPGTPPGRRLPAGPSLRCSLATTALGAITECRIDAVGRHLRPALGIIRCRKTFDDGHGCGMAHIRCLCDPPAPPIMAQHSLAEASPVV